MSEDSCQADTQQLQESLLAVKEDQVVAALGSSLDLLRRACQDAGGGRAPAVTFRVACSCLVLQRAAALAACSDFLLPEVVAALQSGVHAVPAVRAALLDAHLPELLRVPPAFELLLRSLPHDSRQLGRLYAGVLAAAPEGAPLLRPGGVLAAHARRELHKLMRGLPPSGVAEGGIQLAPHLPHLLRLALRIRASAPGDAQALDSSESTALQPAASATGPACASPAAVAAVWVGDVAVKAAAACLRWLRDPGALPRLLGRGAQASGEGVDPPAATDCLALLIGSAAPGERAEAPGDGLATATALVEVLLEALLLSPQAAHAIQHAASCAAEQAQSPAPACAASSAGPAGRVPPAAASPAPPGPAPRVERACLDLLGLHEALAGLQAGDQSDSEEEPPPPATAGVLAGAALLALADLALRQLQTGGGGGEAAPRRASTRTRTPASREAGDGRSCLPPRAAAHLLRLLTAADRAARAPADVAGLALGFGAAAFRGPLPLVAYRLGPPPAPALAAKRRLGAGEPPPPGPAATPGSAPGRRAKRPRATPTASAEPPAEAPSTVAAESAAPEAATTPAVGVGPPPPRGFSRLRPWSGSAQPASGSARQSGPPPRSPPRPQQTPAASLPAAAKAASGPKATPRRITPTPVPAADAAQASVEEGVLDSLAAQKDEYDAYWAHYIAVKEELVATVLQDDAGGEDGRLLAGGGAGGGQSPRGRGAGTGLPRRAGLAGSGDRSPAFREPEWQGLQAASLRLLADALQQAAGGGSGPVWQVLGREAAWRDRRQLALLGSRIEDPSVAPSPRLYAAMLGAQELPHECLVLGVATRLAQYCIGPGPPVAAPLAAAFLRLQRWLTERCLEEALPAGAERLVRPLELAGRVLLACVERSWLRRVPLGRAALGSLLSCALPAAEPEEAVLLAAVALSGAVQGGADSFPTWLGGCPPGWRELWARLPSPQHARAACAQLLAQAPHLLAELQQAGREETSARGADAGLQAQAALAAALAGFCSAVAARGKEVATGAALRDCLLAAAILLQTGAAACAALAQRLAPPHAACQVTGAGEAEEQARGRKQHSGPTPAESTAAAAESCASGAQAAAGPARGLAALAGAGSRLADAAGRLLAWRLQHCPRRAQEPAAAVAALRAACAEAWDRLDAHPRPAEVGAWLRRAAGLAVGGCAAGELAPAAEEAGASEDDAAWPARGRWRPRNAYLRAALAEEGGRGGGGGGGSGSGESGDESSYSDLEDFVVCKDGRDYSALLAREFAYRPAGR